MTEFIDAVSNPMAPDPLPAHVDLPNVKLSNSDFRKLLMTPRPSAQVSHTDADSTDTSTHNAMGPPDKKRHDNADRNAPKHKHKPSHKKYHTKQKKDHKDNAGDASQRYRDRAKERRDGKLVTRTEDIDEEHEVENDDETLTRTADYRAVAPSSAADTSHAERRKLIIQESKYLGGDMEHTHLVKGLDYVLLQKVRLEIQNKELEAEQVLDAELEKPEKTKESTSDEGIQFRTRFAASICDIILNNQLPERNEYFQPGRMAYRIELEDDSVDFEVPATVIRSKSDCLSSDGHGVGAITTNEIVINKLTQILSYLRAGKRHAKKAKLKGRLGDKADLKAEENTFANPQNKGGDLDIYDGLGTEYVPSVHPRSRQTESHKDSSSHAHHAPSSSSDRHADEKHRSSHHARGGGGGEASSAAVATTESSNRSKSYFDKPANAETNAGSSLNATKEFMSELTQRFGPKEDDKTQEKASLERFFAKTQVTCYDECYPGFAESYDAMGDSDDEADFSKMDLGNKKGPIGRWDFETQEEYSDYMSNKEALPKAAFQYGVKMADGRRTRRIGPKDEKAELDRELQKIQSIIQKRKQIAEDGGIVAKNPRY